MSEGSLLVTASDVRAIVSRVGCDLLMDSLIARLTQAIRSFDAATARVPARDGIQYANPAFGLLEWMPAHLGPAGTLVKVVGYHPTNPDMRRLPTVISTMYLFDAASGHLTAIVDGTFLTALRTGAASAIASRVLAPPRSRTLGVIGCGAQAVTQVHALSRVFPLERVLAYDIRADVAASLGERLRFVDVPVDAVAADDLPALVADCDILSTCTSAAPGTGPVFADGPMRPHLHVNAVGSDFPGKYEVPVTLLRRALVCPDFREQATKEGECQQLAAPEIGPDFPTLVRCADEYAAARERLTVFDSTGWALEDHATALMMFDLARGLGVGQEIELECLPPDPKNPYSFIDGDTIAAATAVAVTAQR